MQIIDLDTSVYIWSVLSYSYHLHFTRLMKYLQPENKCMEKSLSKMSKPCEAKRSQIMDLIRDYTGRYCTDTDPKPEVIQSECS